MGHVIDVAERGEEAAVLTDTGSGGLLGSQFLNDAPLETYLDDPERPRYVLHNKKDGLRMARDGSDEQAAPDDGYRALTAVTDVRVLFVVGRATGDVAYSVPLVDVVDVSVDDGLVAGTLSLTTEDARYEFPCRGDLDPVVTAIDGNAQATVRAYRLLDDAWEALDDADERLSEGEFAAALEAVATAEENVRTARNRLGAVGNGALSAFDEDSDEAQRRIRERPRAIHAAHARDAHAEAQSCWADGEYEQAHDRYETAITAYRNAWQAPGDEPADEGLATQREQAEAERDELQRAPLADAQQVAHGAASIDGPAPAAERWETAIRRYQDVLWLDWGRDERRFDGEPEAVREAIVDAVDNIVTERRAAARACREAAHAHRMNGANDAARHALRVALAHLDRAQSVVDEVAPNRATGLDDTRAAVEDELAAVVEEATDPAVDTGGRPADLADGDLSDPVTLVADYWTEHGWTVERDDGDLIATSEAPIELRAFVQVAGFRDEPSPNTVDDCAEMAQFVDADFPVLVTNSDPTALIRERARERGVYVQNLSNLLDEGTTASSSSNGS